MIADDGKKLFFIPLIRHEFNGGLCTRTDGRRSFWHASNLIFYGAVLFVVLFLVNWHHLQVLRPIWNVCWGLPWITFGISISAIRHESRQDTVGWWLALPYSRLTLISSKFWAMLIRSIKILGQIFLAIIAYAAIALLLIHGGTNGAFLNFLNSGFKPVLLDFLVLPLMVSTGLTIGLVYLTRWRSAMSKFWVLWGLLWFAFGSFGFKLASFFGQGLLFVTLGICLSLMFSLLLLVFAAWLLKNKVDID